VRLAVLQPLSWEREELKPGKIISINYSGTLGSEVGATKEIILS
jgi:hypothetical protein